MKYNSAFSAILFDNTIHYFKGCCGSVQRHIGQIALQLNRTIQVNFPVFFVVLMIVYLL